MESTGDVCGALPCEDDRGRRVRGNLHHSDVGCSSPCCLRDVPAFRCKPAAASAVTASANILPRMRLRIGALPLLAASQSICAFLGFLSAAFTRYCIPPWTPVIAPIPKPAAANMLG